MDHVKTAPKRKPVKTAQTQKHQGRYHQLTLYPDEFQQKQVSRPHSMMPYPTDFPRFLHILLRSLFGVLIDIDFHYQ